jgi:hypothetical protein
LVEHVATIGGRRNAHEFWWERRLKLDDNIRVDLT